MEFDYFSLAEFPFDVTGFDTNRDVTKEMFRIRLNPPPRTSDSFVKIFRWNGTLVTEGGEVNGERRLSRLGNWRCALQKMNDLDRPNEHDEMDFLRLTAGANVFSFMQLVCF